MNWHKGFLTLNKFSSQTCFILWAEKRIVLPKEWMYTVYLSVPEAENQMADFIFTVSLGRTVTQTPPPTFPHMKPSAPREYICWGTLSAAQRHLLAVKADSGDLPFLFETQLKISSKRQQIMSNILKLFSKATPCQSGEGKIVFILVLFQTRPKHSEVEQKSKEFWSWGPPILTKNLWLDVGQRGIWSSSDVWLWFCDLPLNYRGFVDLKITLKLSASMSTTPAQTIRKNFCFLLAASWWFIIIESCRSSTRCSWNQRLRRGL